MRKHLITAMAVTAVAVLGFASSAFAASANTSTFDVKFNPPNTGVGFTPGGLFVETTTLHDNDTAGTPTDPQLEPVPTTQVDLNFDHDLVLAVNAVQPCTGDLTGTTQDGMKACGASYIGGGASTVCAASAGPGTSCDLGVVTATVSAYNGPRNGANQATILLQAVADRTVVGPLTVVLEGTIRNSGLGGEFAGGKRLTVPVPLIPPALPGAAAITDFAVNINNDGFIKARCNGDQVWNYRARFDYSAGFDNRNKNQPCT